MPHTSIDQFPGLTPERLREMRRRIRAWNGARPWHFLGKTAQTWTEIIGLIAAAVYVDHWAMSLATIFLVATRQHVLGYLMHEQAHHLGFRGKYGDLWANFLTAYPLCVLTVEGYAQVHLAHHHDYFTPDDPDFLRKSGSHWSYPLSKRTLCKLWLQDLCGLSVIELIRGKRHGRTQRFRRRMTIPRSIRILYYVCIAGALTYWQLWPTAVLYYFLPLVTVLPALVRWGALCEHIYNQPNATPADTSPIIVLSWWERILMPNLNFNYHPYHHFFPTVSFAYLHKIHALFTEQGYVQPELTFHGYRAYWKYITTPATPA